MISSRLLSHIGFVRICLGYELSLDGRHPHFSRVYIRYDEHTHKREDGSSYMTSSLILWNHSRYRIFEEPTTELIEKIREFYRNNPLHTPFPL